MITMTQAINAREFHAEAPGLCERKIGPRGGVTVKQEIWRRNGKTQLWKTRPTEFRTPIKHGLRDYSDITQDDANRLHTSEDCPLN